MNTPPSILPPNKGTIVALAGSDYTVIATDTNSFDTDEDINAKSEFKLAKLTDRTIFGSTSGCLVETFPLMTKIKPQIEIYDSTYKSEMPVKLISKMISRTINTNKFFPYYVSNLISGLNTEGEGVIYSFSPHGHMESNKYKICGSSGAFLYKIIDKRIGIKTPYGVELPPLSIDATVSIIHDSFIKASDYDKRNTKRNLLVAIITANGIDIKEFKLRVT